MRTPQRDLIVLHEHPEWQKPLFAALERRGVDFEAFDVTRAAFANEDAPRARLYFNQASPSAYVRGNTRAVPLALAYMRTLERQGCRVLNGADVFATGAEQERAGHSAPHAAHRHAAIDHLQRSRSAARSCGSHHLARRAQARPGRQRRAHPGGGVARAGRRDLPPRPVHTGCPTTCSCCRNTCRTTRSRESCAWNSWAASCSMRCA